MTWHSRLSGTLPDVIGATLNSALRLIIAGEYSLSKRQFQFR